MKQSQFDFEISIARVLFGPGRLQALPDEAARLNLRKVLVLCGRERQEQGQKALGLLRERGIGLFDGARVHTPVEVTEKALAVLKQLGADGLVAIGGGSTTGLAKALALRTDLPQIVVPTTYAGSEMTPIIGETRNGVKATQRTLKVLPKVVIYDVRLTLGLPPSLSVNSGINALAHAAEALYAQDRNPVISLMAEEGARALISALPRITENPRDEDARADALYGAWLCGVCLGSVGMALHHKLCHVLGGTFNLPHAETHAVVLPHALAYTLPAAGDARHTLSRLFRGDNPVLAVYELGRRLHAPTSLRELGMPEGGIDQAVELAIENPYWSPRALEREAIRGLISRAWAGVEPEAG